MDQTSSLSSALSNSSSLLSGLLAQMSDAYGSGSAQSNLFSSFAAEINTVQSELGNQTQTAHETTAASTSSTPTPSSSSLQTSSDNSFSFGSSSQTPSSANLKTAIDIATALNKALVLLRHESSKASSGNSNDNDTATSTPASTTTTATTPIMTTGAPASTTGDTPGVDTAPIDNTKKALTEVIAELLALLQLVVQKLPQTQTTSGGVATNSAPIQTATQVAAAAAATTAASDLATTIETATDATAPAAAPDTAAVLPEAADPTAALVVTTATAVPLIKILETIEKDVQKLLAPDMQAASTATSSTNTASVTPVAPVVTDMVAQLAQFDAALKGAIVALQSQTQNGTEAKASTNTAQTVASVTPDVPTTKNTPTPNTSDRTAALTDTQTLSAAAPAASSATATAAPTTAQPASTNITVAATTANAGTGSDSDSSANGKSNGEHSSSFAADTITNSTSGLSAEGAQATGTYNFASTLSAFRAANGGTTGLPSAVEQVVLQLNRGVKNGDSQISVQLQPGDLGKITVKLDVGADGKVQGTVTADNPKTLDMLQKDSRSLERALQDAGLRADQGSLQFSLSKQGNQNGAGQTANNGNNSGAAAGAGTQSASDTADNGLVDIGTLAETYYLTPTGVNISV
jgi:hypothetical protein